MNDGARNLVRSTANLDCRGKPAPKIFDRFKIGGREMMVTSVTALPVPILQMGREATHKITFIEYRP